MAQVAGLPAVAACTGHLSCLSWRSLKWRPREALGWVGQLDWLVTYAAAYFAGKIVLISCCIHTLTWQRIRIPAKACLWNASVAGQAKAGQAAAGSADEVIPRNLAATCATGR